MGMGSDNGGLAEDDFAEDPSKRTRHLVRSFKDSTGIVGSTVSILDDFGLASLPCKAFADCMSVEICGWVEQHLLAASKFRVKLFLPTGSLGSGKLNCDSIPIRKPQAVTLKSRPWLALNLFRRFDLGPAAVINNGTPHVGPLHRSRHSFSGIMSVWDPLPGH